MFTYKYLNLKKTFVLKNFDFLILKIFNLWGLGIGDWGLGNPPTPESNPQSPMNAKKINLIEFDKKLF